MVLYIHEIQFHRYSIWYIQGKGNDPERDACPRPRPGVCGPCTARVVTRARTRPTADGPGGGGGRRPHSSSSARVVMGARASRVDVEDGSASERIERGRRSAKIRVRDARRGDAIGG